MTFFTSLCVCNTLPKGGSLKVMTRLIFVRHPETEGNVLSNSDAAKLERPNHLFRPTPNGVRQMDLALKAYIDLGLQKPDKIFCSTFLRTRVLAEKFAKHFNTLVVEDSRLNEKWDGIFHALSEEEIVQRYPDQVELKRKIGWYHYTAPGGENGPTVELRIHSFLRDLSGQTVFIAAHGNWLHLLEKVARGLSWQEVEHRRREQCFPNCSLSEYILTPPACIKAGDIDRYTSWGVTKTTHYS